MKKQKNINIHAILNDFESAICSDFENDPSVLVLIHADDLHTVLTHFFDKIPKKEVSLFLKYFDFGIIPNGKRVHILSLLVKTKLFNSVFPGRIMKNTLSLFDDLNNIFENYLIFSGNANPLVTIEYPSYQKKKPQLWYLG